MRDSNNFDNAAEYGPQDASCRKSCLKKIPVVLCEPEGAAILISEGRVPVFLVRHGQTDWNLVLRLQGREHVELNETGIEQSKKCAELFSRAKALGLDIEKVYTSPLMRARDTADIISNALGLGTSSVEEALIERDYGELSGLTLEERKIRFPKGERQAANVESVPDAAFRMKKALVTMTQGAKGDLIAVTHGGVINALFLKITNGKVGTGKNLSDNCGISIVAVDKKATVPLAYNLNGEEFLDYVRRLKENLSYHDKK